MFVERHDGRAVAGDRDLEHHVIVRISQEWTPHVVDIMGNTHLADEMLLDLVHLRASGDDVTYLADLVIDVEVTCWQGQPLPGDLTSTRPSSQSCSSCRNCATQTGTAAPQLIAGVWRK